MSVQENLDPSGAIAIIGLAGRFPGADNLERFWRNLREGVESVKFFSREELIAAGLDRHLLDNPRFVAADAVLEGIDRFDATFFDYSAREAEILDPQQRVFLECAWEALENAGYSSDLYPGKIAVFAGSALSGYLIRNLYSNPGLIEQVGFFKVMLANSQDFLSTRVSYKLNLTGPSLNVNTLCSSSLVAVHLACQNLQNYSCDLALAGGVSFQISRNEAFFYQEGGIGASDGHCRAFDAGANGTVSGSGLGIVVLKRLEEAVADGDQIWAVIRGSAVNNDGSAKNSFTAPNPEGQAECIAEAIAMSGVDPGTITYVEAHGTGTNLGDPIEIAALTKAFRASTDKKGYCAVGSVKTNIGHLVTAGGVASLIKTILAMRHRQLPPSLNFREPNPKIDFAGSPFFVNDRLREWRTEGFPLRAGVSSFGIGGTNAHVVLEEARRTGVSGPAKPVQLVPLSAKTEPALTRLSADLRAHVTEHPELNLADLAYTMQVGRKGFRHRRFVVCDSLAELTAGLAASEEPSAAAGYPEPPSFLFPGEESARVNMAHAIYRFDPVFREEIDRCAAILTPLLGVDLREVLYRQALSSGAGTSLGRPSLDRAAAFATGWALARMLMAWGIAPSQSAGRGVGRQAAAALAGIKALPEALALAVAEDPPPERELALDPPGSAWQEMLQKPGRKVIVLGSLASAMTPASAGPRAEVMHLLSDREEADWRAVLMVLGHLWRVGGFVDWFKVHTAEDRRRIPLPTYPFARQRYWVEPGSRGFERAMAAAESAEEPAAPELPPGDAGLRKRPRPELSTPYQPPRNDLERIIVQRWQEVLGFDAIGVEDNFFELGGHSLLAAAIANDLGKILPVQIPMRDLLSAATVAEIADLIQTLDWASQKDGEDRTAAGLEEGSL